MSRKTYPVTEDGKLQSFQDSKPRTAAHKFAGAKAKEAQGEEGNLEADYEDIVVIEDSTNGKLFTYGVTVYETKEDEPPTYHPALTPESILLDERNTDDVDSEAYAEAVSEATYDILAEKNSIRGGEQASWGDIDIDTYLDGN